MSEIVSVTKGGASPSGKQKVFFACQGDDFAKYFAPFSDALFEIADVAIYHEADPSSPCSDNEARKALDNAAFVAIPFTPSLLGKPSRILYFTHPYVQENHIPVLFLIDDPSILPQFHDHFENMPYLDPFDNDVLAQPFAEQLADYVHSILPSEELIKRIDENMTHKMFIDAEGQKKEWIRNAALAVEIFNDCIIVENKEDCDIIVSETTMPENEDKPVVNPGKLANDFALSIAEKLGGKDGLYLIGRAYLHGFHVRRDYDKAFEYITAAARQHNPEAIATLANCFMHGSCTACDYNSALFWQTSLREIDKSPKVLAKAIYLSTLNNDIDQAINLCGEAVRNTEDSVPWINKIRLTVLLASLQGQRETQQARQAVIDLYEGIVAMLKERYEAPLTNEELDVYASVLARIGSYIANIPPISQLGINAKNLPLACIPLRESLEKLNRVSFDFLLSHSLFQRKAAQQMREMFTASDATPETNAQFLPSTPDAIAEDLLLSAFCIYDRLFSSDVHTYGKKAIVCLEQVAQLQFRYEAFEEAESTLRFSLGITKIIEETKGVRLPALRAAQHTLLSKIYFLTRNGEDVMETLKEFKKALAAYDALAVDNDFYLLDIVNALKDIRTAVKDKFLSLAMLMQEKEKLLALRTNPCFTQQAGSELIRVCTEISIMALERDLYDEDLFNNNFNIAHNLCKRYFNSDQLMVSYYLCILYNALMRTKLIDIQEDRDEIDDTLERCCEICMIPIEKDSDKKFEMVRNTVISADHYLKDLKESANPFFEEESTKLHNIFSHALLPAITKMADESPMQFIPLAYREEFKDEDLRKGYVDLSFIKTYVTIAFLSLVFLYQTSSDEQKEQLQEITRKTYDKLLLIPHNTYAYRVFKREYKIVREHMHIQEPTE